MTVQVSESPQAIDGYRLYVVAPDVADVVASAGGWLFDRVVEGWEVDVLISPHCAEVRPLHILGVRTRPMDDGFEWLTDASGPLALAVAADVLARDGGFRRHVRKALNRSLIEVRLWGDTSATEIDRPADSVHVLSAAARAFKTQAAVAAGCPRDSAGPTEAFRMATSLPVLSSLTPVR